MKFFFDNNLSPRYAAMLVGLGQEVVHLRETHPPDVDETVWMPDVARQGWIAVTEDRRIERNPHEAVLRRRVGLRVFYLPASFTKSRFWDQALFLVKMWPTITEAAPKMQAGDGLLIQQRGRLRPV